VPDQISVTELRDGAFQVDILQGDTTTRHVVTIPAGLPGTLGHASVNHAELVRQSFLFLLEREPATSILGCFSLDVISRYFPEYVDVVGARLSTE
jgi:hypothetical protein